MQKVFYLTNSYDGNDRHELKAKDFKAAYFEALEILGYSVNYVEEE